MTRHFLVVGAQRCGTTWLHDQLAAHPQIAMARPSRPEPKVFLGDDPVDADAYRARWFAHAAGAVVLGEKSTSYLESPTAPDRVAEALGTPQVVVQLRDPIARAVSNWSFSRDHGVENRPLAEALRANLDGPHPWDPATSSVSPYAYLERGHYVRDLSRWLDRFPVRIQLLEEMLAEPTRIAELYAWLGVDPDVRPEADEDPVNASTTAGGELDDDLVARLRHHFRESDEALAGLLGRDLPWTTRSLT
ncbi:sulfotransferase family protein [Nocardioides euryhalodurans]|uniref:Sulfotransferase domain-containing protein n=1 Tax=Nocardioides euryhalodurans TaxID=2518370 RepID=A0A4P7GPE2_9ACTN|nr:sulfotransferase domain-containing protein [Nocardioides euryhalodurans]QBR93657.1 hypothetical protein EXE57_16280 [Nocardioides euryhalodurans]